MEKKPINLWAHITQELTSLSAMRSQNDAQANKINKAHKKVESREASNDSFTVKAGLRLQEIYSQSVELIEAELKVLERTEKKIAQLIQVQEENYQEERKNKRKSIEKNKLDPTMPKKQKFELDILSLQRGAQVAAKIGKEWILAVVVGPDNGRIEVEDVEDDDDHPGTKKRYKLETSLIIPIADTPQNIEYPIKHEVLALYPASSCFYRATVLLPPSANKTETQGVYVVQFEDDGHFERHINPRMILDFPKLK
jgi:DNA primase catalytic subunit